MKNVKNFLIVAIFLLSHTKSFCWFDALNEKAAQALTPYLVDMSKEIGSEAAKALAISNVEIAKVVVDGNLAIANAIVPSLAEASAETSKALGSDAAIAIANSNLAIAKEIVPVIGAIGIVVATAYSVTQLQPVIKDTYEFIYPTDKQNEEAFAARERIAFYKARVNLRTCFMGSKKEDKRNDSGYPTACEDAAQMLVMCGGETEANRMIAGFNKYWN